jgi:hypothetical protein
LQMPRRGEIHRSFLEMRTRRTLTSRSGYCQVLPELARIISASTDDLKGSDSPITPGFIPRPLARLVRCMPRFNLFAPPPIDPALATLSSEEKLASPLPASPHRCKRDRRPDNWFGTTGVRRQGSTCDNARSIADKRRFRRRAIYPVLENPDAVCATRVFTNLLRLLR